ncbi:MFS transporter [Rhodococcus sp. PAM 2766]|uniref:MFS transporter n=1 Tax=Rhodococcus parequi TaxID=3137122 RepID=A0ABW9FA23_9NOCA
MSPATSTTSPGPSAPPVSLHSSRPRLPLVVYVLAVGTFLMLTTEFVVAGILPEIAVDLGVSLGRAGSLITVFAIGMVVGAPLMTLLTMRMSKKLTLVLALLVFVAGHVFVALGTDLATAKTARFVTALATGAFWAVSTVVAAQAAGPSMGARAVGIVGAGGSLATVLGVPIGALLAQHIGWRGTFWALGGAATVAVFFIARLVPADAPRRKSSSSVLSELADLRSGRLWLVLAACLTTCGGVLATYSFIAPVLTDQAGVPSSLVPLVLTGFGIGSFVGTLTGGRLGDSHPHVVTIVTPAVTTVVLLAMALSTGSAWITVALVVVLGLFGLSANMVLIHLAVGFAGRAATLGSGLSVAAFNAGTAIGTAIAGTALATPLGLAGPATVGTAIVALTLVPTIVLGLVSRADERHCEGERSHRRELRRSGT